MPPIVLGGWEKLEPGGDTPLSPSVPLGGDLLCEVLYGPHMSPDVPKPTGVTNSDPAMTPDTSRT